MKQSLQLKIGQHLTMTPQLQQAIKLLQLSTLDLQQEIQQVLESNPMLDEGEGIEPESSSNSDAPKTEQVDFSDNNDGGKESNSTPETEGPTADSDWQETIPDELPVDTQWDDVYQATAPPSSQASSDSGDFDFDSRNGSIDSLQDHLMWQLNLTRMSDLDRTIGMAIIDATDGNGRLTQTAEELHASFELHNPDIELDEVYAVLHRIQQFDPPGVAAVDLQECMLIQLNQLAAETPWLEKAKMITEHHLDLLGSRDFPQLMRRSKLKEPQLQAVLTLIQSLNPNPGEAIASDTTEYIVPDVYVKKIKDFSNMAMRQ